MPGGEELVLVHALPHVPVDEGPLGVHEVKLVVDSGPDLADSGRVAQHDGGTADCGQVSPGNGGGGLGVDAHLAIECQEFSVCFNLCIKRGKGGGGANEHLGVDSQWFSNSLFYVCVCRWRPWC